MSLIQAVQLFLHIYWSHDSFENTKTVYRLGHATRRLFWPCGNFETFFSGINVKNRGKKYSIKYTSCQWHLSDVKITHWTETNWSRNNGRARELLATLLFTSIDLNYCLRVLSFSVFVAWISSRGLAYWVSNQPNHLLMMNTLNQLLLGGERLSVAQLQGEEYRSALQQAEKPLKQEHMSPHTVCGASFQIVSMKSRWWHLRTKTGSRL